MLPLRPGHQPPGSVEPGLDAQSRGAAEARIDLDEPGAVGRRPEGLHRHRSKQMQGLGQEKNQLIQSGNGNRAAHRRLPSPHPQPLPGDPLQRPPVFIKERIDAVFRRGAQGLQQQIGPGRLAVQGAQHRHIWHHLGRAPPGAPAQAGKEGETLRRRLRHPGQNRQAVGQAMVVKADFVQADFEGFEGRNEHLDTGGGQRRPGAAQEDQIFVSGRQDHADPPLATGGDKGIEIGGIVARRHKKTAIAKMQGGGIGGNIAGKKPQTMWGEGHAQTPSEIDLGTGAGHQPIGAFQ